jgi:glycosyltransferase involved in cell wall biosynthesis
LVENEDARLKMGEAGYNRVSRLFSVKKMVEETAAIYERLIKEKNVEVN